MKDLKTQVSERYKKMKSSLNEKTRRLFMGSEAMVIGHGGIALVAKACNASPSTVSRGIKDIKKQESNTEEPETCIDLKMREEGGGRKSKIKENPAISEALDKLIDPVTRGEPDSPLRWTSKSIKKLSNELKAKGHDVSPKIVANYLKENGYSLQANRKTDEGKGHPDRDAQFGFINEQAKLHLENFQPVISVDAKKKELVGNYKNNGKEWHKKGEPEKVNVYDFLSAAEGKAIPYGVYDIAQNDGWVSVGIDHDTAEFAVQTIKRWWNQMGKTKYANASRLMITADGGGSNGVRNKLWKRELQSLANEIGLIIDMCHFPPATSKWNKIEHRMFSHISQNWRGVPLQSFEIILNLIAATTTEKGLKINSAIDNGIYEIGKKVSDEEMENIKIVRSEFHGEWNYSIYPQKQ